MHAIFLFAILPMASASIQSLVVTITTSVLMTLVTLKLDANISTMLDDATATTHALWIPAYHHLVANTQIFLAQNAITPQILYSLVVIPQMFAFQHNAILQMDHVLHFQ
jgi:hypothetical protein